MSGVLTVLVAGIVMAHFNFYNLSMTGQVATGYFSYKFRTTYQSVAFIAEAIVFIYLGVSFMYYITTYSVSISFFGLELIICIISRLAAIFVLGYAVKAVSKWVLSANEMAIVSTAGTIRGSVAFALILTV
jgi:NhaP-type Na+/H+ or K+/H+ antiporter